MILQKYFYHLSAAEIFPRPFKRTLGTYDTNMFYAFEKSTFCNMLIRSPDESELTTVDITYEPRILLMPYITCH